MCARQGISNNVEFWQQQMNKCVYSIESIESTLLVLRAQKKSKNKSKIIGRNWNYLSGIKQTDALIELSSEMLTTPEASDEKKNECSTHKFYNQ